MDLRTQRDQTSLNPDKALRAEGAYAKTFQKTLSEHELVLVRGITKTLQINTGLICNQTCGHCHLNAGPGRSENMNRQVAQEVAAYALRGRFDTVDITGGAPELNSNIVFLLNKLSPTIRRIMVRSNLSVLNDEKREELLKVFKANRVVVVASLPSVNRSQADSQRGAGIFESSIRALKKLNAIGYGMKNSGLELNLVSNPSGAFLPPPQSQTEERFRRVLRDKWGIEFNRLFSFANVPLGRFRLWLEKSGNLTGYLAKLAAGFNPCAVDGVMCRTMVSVSWEGHVYDCDFNISRGLPLGGNNIHVSQLSGPPGPGKPIAVSDHCYACTAGSGFT